MPKLGLTGAETQARRSHAIAGLASPLRICSDICALAIGASGPLPGHVARHGSQKQNRKHASVG